MTWIEVAQVSQLPVSGMKSFTVGGKEVLVAGYEGNYYALDNICAHAGGRLSDGVLEGNIVTCPKHGSKFDITARKGIAGPCARCFKKV
jgi:3-phenylpropionate/trans-cinnamate dioxygenase ferredoxin subunit